MVKQQLHEGWTVQAVGDLSEVPYSLRGARVAARVPGCVHTDLIRAGRLDDPYLDRNEFKSRWIGHTDWQYTTTFVADAKLFDHERIDLVCDGLDTVAQIVLNDELLATTQNMHRGYRFDVRSRLRFRGPNTLAITFASPVKYAEQMRQKLGSRPYVNGPGGPFNFIRKMACNFGWDWGPALPTCGIWRGIRLEGWSVSRVRDFLVEVHKEGEDALVRFRVTRDLVGKPSLDFGFDLHDPSGRKLFAGVSEDTGWIECVIDQPQWWWPLGHGDQPLYRLGVENWSGNVGLRTIELDTSPDDIGRKFVLRVNGKPIFCKGFNWIPDDCFLDRACEPNRVRQRIQQAIDAGGNMLRVWGGGIFETDDFYNICDELGVLVWQDFLFACAMYPEEPPFWDEVEAEARYNVARLAHHPSLAIWNGCNENIWAYRDWGWKDHADIKSPADGGAGRTWGKNYYFDLLPRICKELTPAIPYWAGSPWSGDYDVDNGVPPNAATHGNKHVWEAWFKEDYAVYRTFEPRFCSEFGFQGPATYSSIARVVPAEARDFGSPEMRHRQKSGDRVRDDGDRRNLRHLIRHFNLPGAQELLDALEPADPKAPIPECGAEPLHAVPPLKGLAWPLGFFDDLHYLLSVNQCRALTLGVEWFRSRQPTCMGTLYWQLNDCWPGATSWSCVDGDGKPKLLWYATRKFFAERLLTIQPRGGTYAIGDPIELCAVNDTDQSWQAAGEAWIQDMRYGGRVSRLVTQSIALDVPPRSVRRMLLAPNLLHCRRDGSDFSNMELLVAECSGLRAHWYFHADRDLDYPAPKDRDDLFEAELTVNESRHALCITAGVLLRDLCVLADRIDPRVTVTEQLVTLLPHESFTFVIDSPYPLSKEQLISPTVLRYVNPFGAKE